MKKSQLHGQIFIYILTIVLVGLILLFGYNGIKSLFPKSCIIEELNFKTEIEQLVDKNSKHGSSEKAILDAPCDYEQLCFIDAEEIGSVINSGSKAKAIIENSVKDGVKRNVFLIKDHNVNPQAIYFSQLRIETSTELCISSINGEFRIFLNGLGMNVYVESFTS